MATLKLENVNKIYPNGVQAVYDFNLEVKDKEFIVFVGPSGCGKSTTLRMIAGLEDITYGNLYIDGKLVNDVLPKDRDIEMVFQNYALFPHLDVYENLAFSLKIHKNKIPVLGKDGQPVLVVDRERIRSLKSEIKMLQEELGLEEAKEAELSKLIQKKKAEIVELKHHPSSPKTRQKKMSKLEIDERVRNVAQILGLTPYLKSRPAELSGGQRQRVALGRAIVRNAKVFLMDEPLSNLDAKLRIQMRSEIIRLHRELGATTIYVTHDQTEAMTMADRIVIMKDGRVQQIGTPEEVFSNPANVFVASFVGSPAMNLFSVKCQEGKLHFPGGASLSLSPVQAGKLRAYDGKNIIFGIRPEDMVIQKENGRSYREALSLILEQKELLGHDVLLYGKVSDAPTIIKAKAFLCRDLTDCISFYCDEEKMYFFDETTKERIL